MLFLNNRNVSRRIAFLMCLNVSVILKINRLTYAFNIQFNIPSIRKEQLFDTRNVFDTRLTVCFVCCQKMENTTKNNSEQIEKFFVVGIISSDEFQKARFIVEKLFKSFPGMYENPEIRPMLDVEWDDYLIKVLYNICQRILLIIYILDEKKGKIYVATRKKCSCICQQYIYRRRYSFIEICTK